MAHWPIIRMRSDAAMLAVIICALAALLAGCEDKEARRQAAEAGERAKAASQRASAAERERDALATRLQKTQQDAESQADHMKRQIDIRREGFRLELYQAFSPVFFGVALAVLVGVWFWQYTPQSRQAFVAATLGCLLSAAFFVPMLTPMRFAVFGLMVLIALASLKSLFSEQAAGPLARGAVLASAALLGVLTAVSFLPTVHSWLGLSPSGLRERLSQQKDVLAAREDGIDKLLIDRIPLMRKTLMDHFQKATSDANTGSGAEVKDALGREVKQIAALMVALDGYEHRCRDARLMLESSQRQLTRLILSRETLAHEVDAQLEEAAKIDQDAAVLLDTQLNNLGVSSGAIDELKVNAKLAELGKR